MSASTFVITLDSIIKTISNLREDWEKKNCLTCVFTIFCSPCSSVPIKLSTELKEKSIKKNVEN